MKRIVVDENYNVNHGPQLIEDMSLELPTYCYMIGKYTVKPVLSGHSKIDKTKILMTSGSLCRSKVLQNAPFGAFCNTSDLH